MTLQAHLTQFPSARTRTIVHLMAKEKKTPEFYTDATLQLMLVAAVAKALSGFTREQALRGGE